MKRWSIARRLFAAQVLVLALLAVLTVAVILGNERAQAEQHAGERVRGVAVTIAADSSVAEALLTEDPSAILQPYAERVMDAAPVDFVSILRPDGTRITHRDPAQIGARYLGTIDPAGAVAGTTETFTGTLGPSVRALVAVTLDGVVVGYVAVGVTIAEIEELLLPQIPGILGLAAGVLLVGALVAAAVERYLRRLTHGLGPEELGRVFALQDAALTSAREGMMIADGGHIVLANQEAARALGIDGLDDPGQRTPLDDPRVPAAVAAFLAETAPEREAELQIGDRVFRARAHPAAGTDVRGETIIFLRDRTRVHQLGLERDGARALAEALRTQSHDYANRLHAIIALIEMGRGSEAAQFAASEWQAQSRLAERVAEQVQEPALAAVLLTGVLRAHEQGLACEIVVSGTVPEGALSGADAVAVVGNLIDNAREAAALAAGEENGRGIEVEIIVDRRSWTLSVIDDGAGLAGRDLTELTTRGFSTRDGAARGNGLALVAQTVHRLGGTVDAEDLGPGTRFSVTLPLPGEQT